MSSVYYLKQTVFSSRLCGFYFTDFNVRCTKHDDARYKEIEPRFRGKLQKRILTGISWQELTEPTESMDNFLQQSDDDDDDQFLRELEDRKQKDADKMDEDIIENDEQDSTFIRTDITISSTSISIGGGRRYMFPASVLSACVLPGNEHTKGEDALIVTLDPGYILLIRVTRNSDGDFCPLVVQRAFLGNDSNQDGLLRLGYHVTSFRTGEYVAVSAFSRVIRLFRVEFTKWGIPQLASSLNITVGGILLKTCFLEPVDSGYVMLVDLIVTDMNLMHLEFHELYLESGLDTATKKSTHSLLSVKFEIPYFVLSLKNTKALLSIQKTQCSLKGMSYFVSHDQADSCVAEYEQSGASPNAYYVPRTKITCLASEEYDDPDLTHDQVLISDTKLNLWLLDVFYNTKKSSWRMILQKLCMQPTEFTHFSMEQAEEDSLDYRLVYMNERGNSESRSITLVPKGDMFKMSVVTGERLENGWFPTYDCVVVDAQIPRNLGVTSAQEFWCLGRSGKRGALFCIRDGITATKNESKPDFLDASKLFVFGDSYYMASFPYKSVSFRFGYDSETDDDKVLQSMPEFDINKATLLLSTLKSGRFLQVFEDGWRFGSLSNDVRDFEVPIKIVLAACDGEHVVFAYESHTDGGKITVSIECFVVSDSGELSSFEIKAQPLQAQPSLVEFVCLESRRFLVVGDYSNRLYFFEEDTFERCFTFFCSHQIENSAEHSKSFTTPHRILATDDQTLLVTSKDGSYMLLGFNPLAQAFKFRGCVRIGESPVEVVSRGNQVYYVFCRTLWRVNLLQSMFPTRVWVAENNDRSTLCGVVTNSNPSADELLVLREDGLNTLLVASGLSACTRKVALGMTGFKLFYSQFHRIFVVLTKTDGDAPKLAFVDHRTRRLLKSNEKEVAVFKDDEYPLTVYEWTVASKKAGAFHHYLIIGCIRRETGQGSLKIVRLKKSKEEVSLEVQHNSKENQPVEAISAISSSTLFYSVGKDVFSRTYVPEEGRMGEPNCIGNYKSAVTSIICDIKAQTVVVNTRTDSFTVGHFDKDQAYGGAMSDPNEKKLCSNVIVHNYELDPEGEASASGLFTVAYPNRRLVSTIRFEDYDERFVSTATEASDRVSYVPRVIGCDFRPVWRDESMENSVFGSTFLSVGLNGQIDLFTLVSKKTYKLLNMYLGEQLQETKSRTILPLQDLCPLEFAEKMPPRLYGTSHVVPCDNLRALDDPHVDSLLHHSLI